MNPKMEQFLKPYLKTALPDIRPGDTVKVYQKLKEANKERIQVFEGLVIARKHGKEISSTITVRKVSFGVGIEKIFPLHLPSIEKIEILKKGKARRAKLYYLRRAKSKKARLKRKSAVLTEEFAEVLVKEKPEEVREEIKEEKEKK